MKIRKKCVVLFHFNTLIDRRAKIMIKSKLLIFSAMLLLCLSCGLHMQEADGATGPVVVYKTKMDYRNHVSVQLSADGNTITAYPGPF